MHTYKHTCIQIDTNNIYIYMWKFEDKKQQRQRLKNNKKQMNCEKYVECTGYLLNFKAFIAKVMIGILTFMSY